MYFKKGKAKLEIAVAKGKNIMTKDIQKKPEIGIVKKQGILEGQVKLVYLSLGSNLGNRIKNLEKAKFLLFSNNVKILKVSNFYESNSWPDIKYPKYLNIALKAETTLKIKSLFVLIKSIEKKIGRKKAPKNYPRQCDIDILDYDGKIESIYFKQEKIEIPHPRLHKRNFVLIPLLEVAKNWVHPNYKEKISDLLSNIKNKDLRSIKII